MNPKLKEGLNYGFAFTGLFLATIITLILAQTNNLLKTYLTDLQYSIFKVGLYFGTLSFVLLILWISCLVGVFGRWMK
jgi:hypothetical protein